jgi:hypothetical protein
MQGRVDAELYDDDEQLTDDERLHLGEMGGDAPPPVDPEPAEREAPEESEEAPAEEGVEEQPRDTAESRRVPLPELLKERERRKRAEDAVNRFEGLLERLSQRSTPEQAPAPEPQVPDVNSQPFEAVNWTMQQVQDMRRQQHEMAEQQQVERERQRFETQLAAHEKQFAEQNADYYDRVDFVGKNFVSQYRFRGHDEASAKQLAAQDMKALAYDIARRGVSPAQYFHQMATETFGYQARPAAPVENGKETRERGRKAFKSLSNVDGSAPKGKRSLEDLANMSDEDFSDYMTSNKLSAEDILKELNRGG